MRLIIIASLSMMLQSGLSGQAINKYIDDVVLPTPNEAALGKYLDVPIQHYTGSSAITIPIHRLGQGPLQSDISLSYHGGGIRAEEMSSRVGLGWSMTAGGSVTRVVKGLADDDASPGVRGFYHYGDDLVSYSTQEDLDLLSGTRDGEPDLYSFSCGSYSGQFFFKKNKEIVLVPKQDVIVEPIDDLSTNFFDGFKLITPDGVHHYFGSYDGTNARTITHPGGGTSYVSTWHLLRSESVDRLHHISYSYEDDLYSYSSTASCRAMTQSCQSIYNSLSGYSGSSTTDGIDCGGAPEFTFGAARFAYRLTNIEGKRLLQINTDDEVVRFISTTDRADLYTYDNTISDRKKALDQIQIETGTYCKNFTLGYDYFIDPGHVTGGPIAAAASKRLKLEQITEQSCDGTEQKPPYTFTYDESRVLPWRHTKAIDHWGYYNGAINNDFNYVNVPSMISGGTSFGASDRESSETHMLTATLESITYPTGGSTSLFYEAHRIEDEVLSNQILLDTMSCITPTPSCCSSTGITVTKGLSFTASQVTDVLADLTIEIPYAGFDCGPNTATAEIIIYEVSVPTNIEVYRRAHSMSVSAAPGKVAYTYSIPNGTIEANKLYSIVLNATNGWGKLQLYQQTVESGDRIVGGLRVQKIIQSDNISASNDIIKSYTYLNEQAESSGLLLYEPTYSYSTQAQRTEFVGDTSLYSFDNAQQFTVAMFSTSSFVPMSNYDNNHIGYTQVTEHHNQNGHTTYDYKAVSPYPNFNYPLTPIPYRSDNGTLEQQAIYVEGASTPISTEVYDRWSSNFFESSSSFKRISERFTCGLPGFGGFAFASTYTLSTEAYRVGRKTFTLDQVTTITDTDYDTAERFTAPVATTMTNSDGQHHHTQYIYPHDVAGVAYDSLVSLNIIQPVETIQSVGPDITTATVTGGTKTTYELFPLGGSFYPKPKTYQNREVTWSDHSSYQDDGYVTQATVAYYDSATGQPAAMTMRGWPQIQYYNWNSNGTLSSKVYAGDSTSYSYHPNTKLLSSMRAVDGTSSSYTYDALMRLDTITDPKGVTSTMDYYYGSGANQNHIIQSHNYPTLGGDKVNHDIIDISYIDGLGRPIQQLAYQQHPTTPTASIATQIAYDPFGRVQLSYEPKLSAGGSGSYSASSGDHTAQSYEASPLNRVTSTTPPQWYATSQTYGSNAAGEVANHHTGTDYPAHSLFKHATIDPEGQVTETFTDKRGRTILSRVKSSSNTTDPDSIADTYTLYDDKDRPIIVLPPQTTMSDTNLIFAKYYSGDDLVIKKDDPDSDPIEMIYDDRDLMTHRQDGERKAEGKWYTYVYDDYGHVVMEGFANSATATISDTLITNIYGQQGVERRKLTNSSSAILSSDTDRKIIQSYSYDEVGRLSVTRSNSILHPDIGSIVDSMIYDSQDNIVESYQKIIPDQITIKKRYTYDHAGRQKKSYIQLTTPDAAQPNGLMQWPEQELSEQNYNAKDLILNTKLGGGLQQIDNSYLPNRFLSAINDPDNMGSDLFAMRLGYDSDISGGMASGITTLQDGNISHTTWRSVGSDKKAYRYTYNHLKMLTEAAYFEIGNNGTYNVAIGYEDQRGNFSSISRLDNGDQIDNMSYNYANSTNQVQSIIDAASGTKGKGYKANTTANFQYNANGAMTFDAGRNTSLYRNHLNLPYKIEVPDSNGMVMNYYDATGVLHRQEEIRNDQGIKIRDYIGGIEYINGAMDIVHHDNGYISFDRGLSEEYLQLSGSETADATYESISTISERTIASPLDVDYRAESFICLTPGFEVSLGADFSATIDTFPVQSLDYRYFIKDHLGQVRSEFIEDGSGIPAVTREVHYFPFGLTMTGPWTDSDSKNNYLRMGGERLQLFDLGYDLHAFRNYDGANPSWTSPEPLSEIFPEWSSYAANGNNPVSNIDPLGLNWYRNNDTGKVHWEEGDDDIEGHRNLGANYIIYGENQMIVHHQNEVTEVVDYADLAPSDNCQINCTNADFPFMLDISTNMGALGYTEMGSSKWAMGMNAINTGVAIYGGLRIEDQRSRGLINQRTANGLHVNNVTSAVIPPQLAIPHAAGQQLGRDYAKEIEGFVLWASEKFMIIPHDRINSKSKRGR